MTNQERRRYPRVQTPFGEIFPFLGARVLWPNNETSDVVDLSYKGMAVRRPGLFQIKEKETVRLFVEIGNERPFECRARLVWSNAEWVGLEITTLPSAGHLALRAFLDDTLLGLSLRQVDREHFGAQSNFSYWYQAGGEGHLFIWVNAKAEVEKVQFELRGDRLELVRGEKVDPRNPVVQKALRILSQLRDAAISVESFVKSVAGR